jgi:hypothetical protein
MLLLMRPWIQLIKPRYKPRLFPGVGDGKLLSGGFASFHNPQRVLRIERQPNARIRLEKDAILEKDHGWHWNSELFCRTATEREFRELP